MALIRILPEDFLYQRLPETVLSEDQRSIVRSVMGGFQDRVEDLRAYANAIGLVYSGELPRTINAVLVDLLLETGNKTRRSLEVDSSTPEGDDALKLWAANKLNVEVDRLVSVALGHDPLRAIDVNTLPYVAETVGTKLVNTPLHGKDEATKLEALRQQLKAYFHQLRTKGTKASFESVGKLLGFDDVMIAALWSRLSVRVPSDVGSVDNEEDFSRDPEYRPARQVGTLYNPHKLDDGAFYTYVSTPISATAGSQSFYTNAVNGQNPFVRVSVIDTTKAVVHPSGDYALAGGDINAKAFVEPAGTNLRFTALSDGADFNGMVLTFAQIVAAEMQTFWNIDQPGTTRRLASPLDPPIRDDFAVLTITDRLSAVKYRSSYFDLGLTIGFDRYRDLFGDISVRSNKDLAAMTEAERTAFANSQHTEAPLSPFRPFKDGELTQSTTTRNFVTEVGTVVGAAELRSQATVEAAYRQFDTAPLLTAGAQALEAMEKFRPASRTIRRADLGFMHDDTAVYAPYAAKSHLFCFGSGNHVYEGAASGFPTPPYTVTFRVRLWDAEQDYTVAGETLPTEPDRVYYHLNVNEGGVNGVISGYYDIPTNSYRFETSGTWPDVATDGPCNTEDVPPPAGVLNFSYFGRNDGDKCGPWGQFSPNGRQDDHWQITVNATSTKKRLKRIELYETVDGEWQTGQAWATKQFNNPPLTGAPSNFSTYPLVVIEDDTQLNSAYTDFFHEFTEGTHLLDLWGQWETPALSHYTIFLFWEDEDEVEVVESGTIVSVPTTGGSLGGVAVQAFWQTTSTEVVRIEPGNTRTLLVAEPPAPEPPEITVAPADALEVTAGAALNFSVTAVGTPTLSYQWFKGSTPITGATGTTLSIPAFELEDAGTYSVTVYNAYGNDSATFSITSAYVANLVNVAISQNSTLKSGPAAIGNVGDYWNTYQFPIDTPGSENPTNNVVLNPLLWSDGVGSDFVMAMSAADESGLENPLCTIFTEEQTTPHSDPMMAKCGVVPTNVWAVGGNNLALNFGPLLEGVGVDVYVYCHGGASNKTTKVRIKGHPEGYKQTTPGAGYTTGFVEGVNYLKFSNVVINGIVAIEVQTGDDGVAGYINGLQLRVL
jgi:hypothetical protein